MNKSNFISRQRHKDIVSEIRIDQKRLLTMNKEI